MKTNQYDWECPTCHSTNEVYEEATPPDVCLLCGTVIPKREELLRTVREQQAKIEELEREILELQRVAWDGR